MMPLLLALLLSILPFRGVAMKLATVNRAKGASVEMRMKNLNVRLPARLSVSGWRRAISK
jgi:hypothetical protein